MSRDAIDYRGAPEAVERILNRGGEPREVLEAVVQALATRGFGSATVTGADGKTLADAGDAADGTAIRVPIVRNGRTLGEISVVAPDTDPRDQALVERVALLISAQLPV